MHGTPSISSLTVTFLFFSIFKAYLLTKSNSAICHMRYFVFTANANRSRSLLRLIAALIIFQGF